MILGANEGFFFSFLPILRNQRETAKRRGIRKNPNISILEAAEMFERKYLIDGIKRTILLRGLLNFSGKKRATRRKL
jgi:hypothetical protein